LLEASIVHDHSGQGERFLKFFPASSTHQFFPHIDVPSRLSARLLAGDKIATGELIRIFWILLAFPELPP
jgi:hypothetical protein